ncbi:hypothetical protein COU20_01895 [Candidatus Kaiserbacteria bacterium CG10_big_fil_rev_8_21_14_0_10_59_10]|uniref:Uncharacterized protein n=1 Tax=Candidatus Kaiserbacteria bacterium CG10_big_fil_rev_8_21_14_0_10_59_10 TaxID=1974612 RepID=A0A2H0U800_9BACT|nr:MAG: hypothetical protein COU20_01895 [Candidatus Kaiserbacteria bacterium CG10_big_fil_rev_8_21_14_0_10_59_10]
MKRRKRQQGHWALYAPVVNLAEFSPLADYSGANVGGTSLSGVFSAQSLPELLNALFKFSISIGAILAVIMLAYGGYLYMADDLWTSKGKAREVIWNAVIGLLLLLAVWLILNQINPDLLNLNILRNAP